MILCQEKHADTEKSEEVLNADTVGITKVDPDAAVKEMGNVVEVAGAVAITTHIDKVGDVLLQKKKSVRCWKNTKKSWKKNFKLLRKGSKNFPKTK